MEPNLIYDNETELKLRTRPITEMPDFPPRLTSAQLAKLAKLPESERNLILPVIEVLSTLSQQNTFMFAKIVEHNASLREQEREVVTRKTSAFKIIVWILGTLAIAMSSAWATAIFTHK